MKTWLDIYAKGWKSTKNNDFNQPVKKESRPVSKFIRNRSLLRAGGGGRLEEMKDLTLLLVNPGGTPLQDANGDVDGVAFSQLTIMGSHFQ